jgi:hypothetical protein
MRDSYDATTAALEIARRLGMAGYIRTLVGNLASSVLELGEWELGIEETTKARDESPDEFSANYASWFRTTFLAYRGEETAPEVERLVAWAESLDDSGVRAAVHGLRAEVAFGSGNFRDACDEWLKFATTDLESAQASCFYAGLAAMLAADQDRARAAATQLKGQAGHSRLRDADERLHEAGLAALDGRRSDALSAARFVLDEYDKLGLPWRRALVGLVLVSTIGPGEPEVRAAAQTARETFVRLRAQPFLELLDTRLAGSSTVGEEHRPVAEAVRLG